MIHPNLHSGFHSYLLSTKIHGTVVLSDFVRIGLKLVVRGCTCRYIVTGDLNRSHDPMAANSGLDMDLLTAQSIFIELRQTFSGK